LRAYIDKYVHTYVHNLFALMYHAYPTMYSYQKLMKKI